MIGWQGFEKIDDIIWGYVPGLFDFLSFNQNSQSIAAGVGINAAFQFEIYLTYDTILGGKVNGDCVCMP